MLFGKNLALKSLLTLTTVLIIFSGIWFITELRANLAISQINNEQLQQDIKSQEKLIVQMRSDIARIQSINNDLSRETDRQRQEIFDLIERFNTNARGEDRNFGAIAAARPTAVQRLVNQGSLNAMRCLELASGASHTEEELAASTISESNRECPSLANPHFVPR